MFCAVAVTALAADETKTEQLQERASSSDDLQTAAAGEGRSKFYCKHSIPGFQKYFNHWCSN